MSVRVGFAGLGVMGLPMARNIQKAGFDLMVYDRQQGPLDEMRSLGAKVARSVGELGEHSDIVEIAVKPQPEVAGLILEPGGLLEAMRLGSIIDNHSTAPPADLQRIEREAGKKGVAVLDAQMSGGGRGAAAATLCFMVGGDLEVLERCRPVLNACGTSIYHVGAVGAGSLAKVAHNAIIAMTLVANAEGFAFAERAGIDLKTFEDVVRHGAAQSYVGNDWLDQWSKLQAPPYNWILETFLGIGGELGLDQPAGRLADRRLREMYGGGSAAAAGEE